MPFAANPYDALKGLSKYLRVFRGKTFVIKLGGEVLDDPDARKAVCEQIGVLWTLSIRIVIVHGGGARLDSLCKDLNLPVEKQHGRRVTTPEVLEAAKMVLAGSTHTDLLAHLNMFGVPCVGLSGIDAGMIKAHKRAPLYLGEENGMPKLLDFGQVGDIDQIDPKLLNLLLDHQYVPVIAPLTGNPDGSVYNTNADTIAAMVAQTLNAEKLFFLLRVPGLLRDVQQPSSLITYAPLSKLDEMESRGEVSGGMLPKVSAIRSAIQGGVRSVHLVSGIQPDAMLVEIFTNEGSGTQITRELGN